MLDKILTTRTFLALTGLVLLWLLILWVSGASTEQNAASETSRLEQEKDNDMVSSIQPIANAATALDAEAAQETPIEVINSKAKSQLLSEQDNADLHNRFNEALKIQQQGGRDEDAIASYQALISDFPRIPENYINLANLHGSNGDLQAARETLIRGIEANQKASTLVQGLQSVHSALAAKAYRKALDVNAIEPAHSAIALPVVLELQTNLDVQDQLQRLQTSLSEQAESSEGSKELVAEYRQQIQSLNKQLDAEKQNAVSADAAKVEQINVLTQRLTQSDEVLAATQAAEREALARVVRAEQNAKTQIEQASQEVSALKEELEQRNVALLAAQQQQQELQVALSSALAAREASDSVASVSQPQQALVEQAAEQAAEQTTEQQPVATQNIATIPTKPLVSDTQRLQAIDRVKSWAQAWSNQDVATYVDQYVDTYTVKSAGSREVWLDQRRVRLTNKKFIRVDVSKFTVDDLGQRYSVTFRQHYKSDVIDDVIFKSLIFEKQAGDDWSQAKIVVEKVVKPR